MSSIKLFGVSGSLRKESYSTAILKTLAEKIAPQATLEIGAIGSIPLYNQDLEAGELPSGVVVMRQQVSEAAGALFVTPEYNYGMSGVIKNAIDWLSRPAGKSCLIGKPFLIISSSPAATGGVRAQAQLRESILGCGARPIITGEIVIASVHTKIADGRLTDQASIDFALKGLQKLIGEAQGAKVA